MKEKLEMIITEDSDCKVTNFGEVTPSSVKRTALYEKFKGSLAFSVITAREPSLEAAINLYHARSSIEATFKDCKSGGYNLEDSKASVERLTSLVLLIALAYTCAGLRGPYG